MSTFVGNIAKLVSSSVIAQILGVLLIPIVTRLYMPDDLGVLQLFLSLTAIIVIVVSLSYQYAILLPERDEEAANIVALCLALLVGSTAITTVLVLVFRETIAALFSSPALADYLLLLPLVVFANGLYVVLNHWLMRRVRFGAIAVSRIGYAGGMRAVQIGGGLFNGNPVFLPLSVLAGHLCALIVSIPGLLGDRVLISSVAWSEIRRVASRFRRFPLFTTLTDLTSTFSGEVASLMLGLFFSTTMIGFYSLSNQVINLPASMVGLATAQVFFQQASSVRADTGALRLLIKEVTRRLIMIGVMPLFVLMIAAGDLFGLLFGSAWATAGTYAAILAPFVFIRFITAPLTSLFNVIERQREGMLFSSALLLSRIVVLAIGGFLGDPVLALVLYSGSGFVLWGIEYLYILRLAGLPLRDGFIIPARYLGTGAVVALPLLGAQALQLSGTLMLVIAIIVSAIYYLLQFSTDPSLRDQVFLMLRIGGR